MRAAGAVRLKTAASRAAFSSSVVRKAAAACESTAQPRRFGITGRPESFEVWAAVLLQVSGRKCRLELSLECTRRPVKVFCWGLTPHRCTSTCVRRGRSGAVCVCFQRSARTVLVRAVGLLGQAVAYCRFLILIGNSQQELANWSALGDCVWQRDAVGGPSDKERLGRRVVPFVTSVTDHLTEQRGRFTSVSCVGSPPAGGIGRSFLYRPTTSEKPRSGLVGNA